MREIKFRGFGTDDKATHWIYGNLLVEKLVDLVAIQDENCHVWEVDPESVGQYTGLRDSDRREIYEGDILRCKNDDWAEEDAEIYTVRYFDDQNYPAFELDGWEDGECNGISYFKCCGELYVIGNIHDNPDLLEKQP